MNTNDSLVWTSLLVNESKTLTPKLLKPSWQLKSF